MSSWSAEGTPDARLRWPLPGWDVVRRSSPFTWTRSRSCPAIPAVGGVGKGQLTREVDALGGEQGRNTDGSFVQIKMLNTSKGPAVRALRAQADKRLYEDWMKHRARRTPGPGVWCRARRRRSMFHVKQSQVSNLSTAVRLANKGGGACHRAHSCGRRVVIGDRSYAAGRVGELPAVQLSHSLESAGLELDRFQSATPPRIDGATIDPSRMVAQQGDEGGLSFSHWASPAPRKTIALLSDPYNSAYARGRRQASSPQPAQERHSEWKGTAVLPLDRPETHQLPRQGPPPGLRRARGSRDDPGDVSAGLDHQSTGLRAGDDHPSHPGAWSTRDWSARVTRSSTITCRPNNSPYRCRPRPFPVCSARGK